MDSGETHYEDVSNEFTLSEISTLPTAPTVTR